MSSSGPAPRSPTDCISDQDRRQLYWQTEHDKIHKKWFKEERIKDVGLKKKKHNWKYFVKSEKSLSTFLLHFRSYI